MNKFTSPLLVVLSALVHMAAAQNLLYIDGSGAQPNLTIQPGAQIYIEGGWVANAGATGMELDGELHLKDGASSIGSDFTDNTISGALLATSSGSVFFESALQQNITASNTLFPSIVFNNSSANTNGIHLLTNVTVTDQVDFRDGLIYANANILLITDNAPSAITFAAPNTSTYSQSWLAAIYPSGKLDREIGTSLSTYAFPVGSTTQSQLLEVIPTDIDDIATNISRFSASWENTVSGTSPISISECGTIYMIVSSGGEWHLRPANLGIYGSGGFSSGNMTLKGYNLSAFSGLVDNQFALLTRAEGNATAAGWSVPLPSCTSLSAFNAPGRTVASDYAVRNNLTEWNDNISQVGMGLTTVPLPIELLSFEGWTEGNVNQLSWITSSEINSDYFMVERSGNGDLFSIIGSEHAAGFSTESILYRFTDFQPLHGMNYYRLKMVDRDETFAFSKVILLENETATVTGLSLYPNPANDHITLQISSPGDEQLTAELTDVLGRVMNIYSLNVHSGNSSYHIKTSHLAAATYFIRVLSGKYNPATCFRFVKSN